MYRGKYFVLPIVNDNADQLQQHHHQIQHHRLAVGARLNLQVRSMYGVAVRLIPRVKVKRTHQRN